MNLAIADAVIAVVKERGATPAQVAQVIPNLGARTVEQLDQALGLLDLSLTDEQMARPEAVSVVDLGFRHAFLGSGARPCIYGNAFDLIDDHRGCG